MPPAPPPLDALAAAPAAWALFLDFDGTLVDLAPTPDAIEVPPELPGLLRELARRFGGALAIITGRALADLDRHLGGVRLPAVGQHGAERRPRPERAPSTARVAALDAARRRVRAFVHEHPGILIEDKGAALALHFRAVPAAGPAAAELAAAIAAESRGELDVTPGKAVVEVRPAGADKGAAVRAFLATAPFRGRRPLVLGDDVTDEAAFAAALAVAGTAVKVGPGPTRAPWRLAQPEAARRWLAGEAP